MSAGISRGSVWRRWDPHIHAPGTALNNQYRSGRDGWEDFLGAIESAMPAVEALGITDYYSLKGYRDVCEQRRIGRLNNIGFIFPNVEIRLGIGTVKGGVVNAHLLFSPEDPSHVEQIESFLGKLLYKTSVETYACTRHDLIRLGRDHKGQDLDDDAAFSAGANQFKVELNQLKTLWKSSAWLAENCLFAVAAAERDGSSGIRSEDDSLETLRKAVEHFASIIFSSNQSQINFWLGKGRATIEDLEGKWGGIKPCLHGSDAHSKEQVANPIMNRYCWIKGDLTFEALRHVCMEPETRVLIGEEVPQGSSNSKTIAAITVSKAPWMIPQNVALNPGLVAVIGARGSGKTAFADLIAAGGYAVRSQLNKNSFLVRAKEHLGLSRAELAWVDGDLTGNELTATEMEDLLDMPRVQYLSQQFVDELCSADGAAYALTNEIHRVLFYAHSIEEREGASCFDELLQIRLEPAAASRAVFVERLQLAMMALASERQLKAELPQLMKQRPELAKLIEQDERDRKALIGKGEEERNKRHQAVQEALDAQRQELEKQQEQVRAIKALSQDVEHFKSVQYPTILQGWMKNRAAAGLRDKEWQAFGIQFSGDIHTVLRDKLAASEARVKTIAGAPMENDTNRDLTIPFVAVDADLHNQSVATLQAEVDRLGRLIGVDKQNSKKLGLLNDKIVKNKKALDVLDARIQQANTADERIALQFEERGKAYKGAFQAIADIENEYRRLYAPLERSLRGEQGSLGRLGIVVKRNVDLAGWAERGENLLDLRKQGCFRGKGSLQEAARESLLSYWQSGTAEEVANAMQQFVKKYEHSLKEHRPESVEPREWASLVASWLYDTSHVTVSYALTYDGIEIERLSPGTRGVVLLLLYLTVDQEDDRPLIIDQPEENLDPKSVYDELVPRFRQVRDRRQVIIVTHNANLVVNTDADQVIVAQASDHAPGKLPEIRYKSGGLEDREIRKYVCDVLEGGEKAFRDRAKRLQLRIGEKISVVQT